MHKGRRLSYFTSHHGVINCQRDYCATSYSCKTCSNVGAVDIFEQNFASYFFWFLISSLWSKWECLFIPPHMIFVWKKSIHRSDSTFNCVSPPFYFGLFFTTVASLLLAFLSFNTGKFHTIAGNIIQSEGLFLTGRVPMVFFYTNLDNEFSLVS